MLRTLVDRLLPRRCVVCDMLQVTQADAVCEPCKADFFSVDVNRCQQCAISLAVAGGDGLQICGRCLGHPPHYDATTTLGDYVSPVDGMVRALKFTARLDLADCFGHLLAQRLPALRDAFDTLVIPVPLAFERARQRGFNQSHHIARAFAAASHCRLAEDRLLRTRHTPPQQSLALKERRRNIRGAFAVMKPLSDRSILVVDDVMTTGSTLDEIARVLKQAGATRVHNLIVARTP